MKPKCYTALIYALEERSNGGGGGQLTAGFVGGDGSALWLDGLELVYE